VEFIYDDVIPNNIIINARFIFPAKKESMCLVTMRKMSNKNVGLKTNIREYFTRTKVLRREN